MIPPTTLAQLKELLAKAEADGATPSHDDILATVMRYNAKSIIATIEDLQARNYELERKLGYRSGLALTKADIDELRQKGSQ